MYINPHFNLTPFNLLCHLLSSPSLGPRISFTWQIIPRNASWLKDSVTSFSPGSSEALLTSMRYFWFRGEPADHSVRRCYHLRPFGDCYGPPTQVSQLWLYIHFHEEPKAGNMILLSIISSINLKADHLWLGMRRSRDCQKLLTHQGLALTTGYFQLWHQINLTFLQCKVCGKDNGSNQELQRRERTFHIPKQPHQMCWWDYLDYSPYSLL